MARLRWVESEYFENPLSACIGNCPTGHSRTNHARFSARLFQIKLYFTVPINIFQALIILHLSISFGAESWELLALLLAGGSSLSGCVQRIGIQVASHAIVADDFLEKRFVNSLE